MFWSGLFFVSVTQGLFVVLFLLKRAPIKRVATRLFILLILVMVATNFDFLLVATPLYQSIPGIYGISYGMRFLIGPIIYFYTLSVTKDDFHWQKRYFLHFLPYLLNLLWNIPLFLMAYETKLRYINLFLAGSLRFRTVDIVIIAIQNVHLFIYIFLSLKWIRQVKSSYGNVPYLVEMKSRVRWLRSLVINFSILLLTIFSLVLMVIIHGKYIPIANKIYTLIISAIIYFIAYKIILDPQLVSPDFERKYKAVKQIRQGGDDEFVKRLKSLLDENKVFTNPDLNLGTLAVELGITTHQLSRLINERFSKSFNDLINEYRVQEFIKRINNPKYRAFSVYGVAMDVGFNSKSSFNSIFKKITGKTPSEFKTE
jgi:AraC-like DNA-binding protein